jgi:hypothetical protein
MLEWVWPIAFPPELIDRMTGFANSNFATSLIGSLTGAFAGAWAAQRIVERSKDRELLAKEIRQLNAATTLLSSVANTHITLKKQHVKRLRDEYEEEHRNVLGFLEARKAGRAPPQQTIDFKADMQTLTPPYTPVDQITRLVFDELPLPAGELFVAPLLLSSIRSLNESLEMRNTLINERKRSPPDPDTFPPLYFGLQHGQNAGREVRVRR